MKALCILLALAFTLGLVTPVCFADEGSNKILKEGLLGAATGAVAAGASGGKAGKGALIGAGVNVVGGALLDSITTPAQPQQQVQQVQTVPVQAVGVQSSASAAYQQGYNEGYQKGFDIGYEKGYQAGLAARR